MELMESGRRKAYPLRANRRHPAVRRRVSAHPGSGATFTGTRQGNVRRLSPLGLDAVIDLNTPGSILARCGLWVVDYRASPEIPLAWATSGWRLWQYASDNYGGRRARGQTRSVQGLDRCDRNLFNGDVAGLYRFWNAAA